MTAAEARAIMHGTPVPIPVQISNFMASSEYTILMAMIAAAAAAGSGWCGVPLYIEVKVRNSYGHEALEKTLRKLNYCYDEKLHTVTWDPRGRRRHRRDYD